MKVYGDSMLIIIDVPKNMLIISLLPRLSQLETGRLFCFRRSLGTYYLFNQFLKIINGNNNKNNGKNNIPKIISATSNVMLLGKVDTE